MYQGVPIAFDNVDDDIGEESLNFKMVRADDKGIPIPEKFFSIFHRGSHMIIHQKKIRIERDSGIRSVLPDHKFISNDILVRLQGSCKVFQISKFKDCIEIRRMMPTMKYMFDSTPSILKDSTSKIISEIIPITPKADFKPKQKFDGEKYVDKYEASKKTKHIKGNIFYAKAGQKGLYIPSDFLLRCCIKPKNKAMVTVQNNKIIVAKATCGGNMTCWTTGRILLTPNWLKKVRGTRSQNFKITFLDDTIEIIRMPTK